MQKNLPLVCMLAGVLTLMMSCGYREALDEEREMNDGKMFSIERGDVLYNNGIRLRFKDNGRMQRLDFYKFDTLQLDSVALLFRDNNCYALHIGRHDYTDMGYYRSFAEFAVPIYQYLLTGSYKSTKETIAGVDCDLLSCYNSADHHCVASYYRLRMFEQEATRWNYFGGSYTPSFHNNTAMLFDDQVPDSIFELKFWDIPNWKSNVERHEWELLLEDIRTYFNL